MPLPDDDSSAANPARTCKHRRIIWHDTKHHATTFCSDCGAYHEELGKTRIVWVIPPALRAAEAEVKRLREALVTDRILIEKCRIIIGKLLDGTLEIGHGFDTEYVEALRIELEARAAPKVEPPTPAPESRDGGDA